MVVLDYMHCVDAGITSYVLGSVWWSLLPHLTRVRHRAQSVVRHFGLQSLKARLKKWYQARRTDSRVPVNKLTLKKPKMKRTFKLKSKAAQANRLVPFTRELAEELRHKDGTLGEDRFRCLWFLEQINILSRKQDLTTDDLFQWRWYSTQFVFHYVRCGYHVAPKFHWFFHFPHIIQRHGAPRSFYLYSDESKNADIKRLFRACSNSVNVCASIMVRLGWQQALLAHKRDLAA